MKTTLRCINVKAETLGHCMVEEEIRHLQDLVPITSAEVVLERQRGVSPPFRVEVQLEVPGPGVHANATRQSRERAMQVHGPALHAEGRDNTLQAALLKATKEVEHQIQSRRLRHLERDKSNLQFSGKASRWSHALVGRGS